VIFLYLPGACLNQIVLMTKLEIQKVANANVQYNKELAQERIRFIYTHPHRQVQTIADLVAANMMLLETTQAQNNAPDLKK
jgi:hypothetical protein